MKVIDILKESAELLGLAKQATLLNEQDETKEPEIMQDQEVATLMNLFRFSTRELCTNYIPVTTIKTIKTVDNKFPINELTNYVRIVKVMQNGQPVATKILNRNLVFVLDGEYEVEYCAYPEINSIFEEIDFLPTFNADVLIYGLCAYFSIARGMFEEFENYHENYKNKAESIRALKTFVMPQRRWE